MKEIPLTKGKIALVDDEDYVWLSQYKWYYGTGGYARRDKMINYKRFRYHMHREIMELTSDDKGLEVDHINGNRLDNRRENLRICTVQQNRQNQLKQKRSTSSKYKGVSFCKERNKWESYIKINRKRKHLGRFNTEEEAAMAYNNKAKELFGEFAKLNKIGGYENGCKVIGCIEAY